MHKIEKNKPSSHPYQLHASPLDVVGVDGAVLVGKVVLEKFVDVKTLLAAHDEPEIERTNGCIKSAIVAARVARWFVFKPKIPIWVNFRGPRKIWQPWSLLLSEVGRSWVRVPTGC
jgi:homogentisate 1,2-dioxygenase